MIYYNELDPYCCLWLDHLLASGELPPGLLHKGDLLYAVNFDLRNFTQCHFFAGIGGWPLALELAEWPPSRPVWTGSCPCQPFSESSQNRTTFGDSRHLWPDFLYLIQKFSPPVIFGEQVTGVDGINWFTHVRADLETLGYAVAAAVIPAASVGALHIRHRLYWVATRDFGVADTHGSGLEGSLPPQPGLFSIQGSSPTELCDRGLLPRLHYCPDPLLTPKFDGLSRPVPIVRAFGNCLVPQVAASFIRAFLESEADSTP